MHYAELGETRGLAYERDLETPTGCCGRLYNKISWYHMIHWGFFNTAVEVAVAITLLYWPLLYRPEFGISGVDFNTHGTQGIVAVIELMFSGVPVRFYHFYFTPAFSAVYVVFSAIYDVAAGGTNVNGSPYIYSILDYQDSPGLAVGTALGVTFVFLPIIHFVFHLVYIARYWIIYLIYGKCSQRGDHTHLDEDEADSGPEAGTELKEI